MSFTEQFSRDKEQIEAALENVFRGRPPHADIYDAMNYRDRKSTRLNSSHDN